MATRRPPSRSRSNNTLNPNAAGSSRPRSALSRPAASHRSELLSQPEERYQPSSSATTTSSTHTRGDQHSNDAGSNIRVVIRTRRRSEREIQENSPIIVTSNGPKGQEVTIETAAPSSTLGVVTLPPTRTYPFDLVFGPEADQAMVYQDVVHPMLEEVVNGYNCTLFAYGQTGTGKTYTMQGDLNLTPLGNPSSQAGMIPRVLFRLFHQLESSGVDYSVKISFIELYNEELRDLLAPELSAPAGLAQPMSFGAPKDSQGGLKVFDDSNKKGVFIQGLEEASVKDFRDALALLSKGSQRRQIAATKFNDHSSRSHSVFSITVHSKEVSSLGDDLLKVGKLNLVDLAGSENIGRSGAENKRAREAGMINQSLLTLGRVINALVDNASHVPYRESKLTRLLQDSLGGRTKTCIIATVSPARSNMEETLSTLDYAIRAKSIRNKPEVNQRMTRNALLKEYVAEIERLKSDVLAAREKNGIYFSEDTWDQINAEHELRQTEVEEAKKQIEIVESQMRTVREEFEQSIALLLKTDSELRDTRDKLRLNEGELVVRNEELQDVRVALEEEKIVGDAHASTERTLDAIATTLNGVVKQSTEDVDGLFKKLDRKTVTFNSNLKTVSSQSKFLDAEARAFLSTLQEFVAIANQHTTSVTEQANNLKKKKSDSLSAQLVAIDIYVTTIQDRFQAIKAKEAVSEEQLASVKTAIDEMQEHVKTGFADWSIEVTTGFETLCSQVEEAGANSCTVIEQSFEAMKSILDTVLKDMHAFIVNERKAEQEKRELANRITDDEVARLRNQNVELLRLVETEQEKAKRGRDELLKRVSSMLVDFSEERDRSLRQAVQDITQDNGQATEAIDSSREKQTSMGEESLSRGRDMTDKLEAAAQNGEKTMLSGFEGINAANDAFKVGLIQARDYTSSSIKDYSSNFTMQMQLSGASCSKALERADRAKRARIELTTSLANDVQTNYRLIQRELTSQSNATDDFRREIVLHTGALQAHVQEYSTTANAHVSSVRKHTQVLREQGIRDDEPTGSTPRKRTWRYVDHWETTKSRDTLLRERRQTTHIPLVESHMDVVQELPKVETEEGPFVVRPDETHLMEVAMDADVLSSDSPSDSSEVSTVFVPLHIPQIPPPKSSRSTSLSKGGKGAPFVKTLTERSTNIMRGRRRNVS